MSKWFYLVAAVLFTPVLASADSIRVGDNFYRDVYIRTSREFYYVCFPETGTVERVSRRRSKVSDVTISEDGAYRDGLLARYEARKAEGPGETASPSAPVPTLRGDLLKFETQLKDLAVFEAQLARWQSLSAEAQEAIAAGLEETLAQRTARRAAERERALAQHAQLGQTKAVVEQEWDSAAAAKEAAVQRAIAEDESAFYLRSYENSKGYIGPYYHFYRDHEDNLRSYATWWYTEDPSLYNAALTERAQTEAEVAAAERAYAAEASAYDSTLDSVEKKMRMRERAARAAVAKTIDDQRRFGSRQALVAAFAEATEAEYRPQLQAHTLASWLGAAPQRLPDFSVARGVWRLDCRLAGSGSGAGFAVTLYNADTDMPFTRISDPDFLGMRTRFFDEPGRYYLVVEQGVLPAPFEIEVSTVEYR